MAIADVHAPTNTVTAAPHSASRTGRMTTRPPMPMANTTTDAGAAPARANQIDTASEVTPKSGDRDHHGERRAAADTEQPGVGQRVARQDLRQAPGRAERGAGDGADQRARQAQVAHDPLRRRAVEVDRARRPRRCGAIAAAPAASDPTQATTSAAPAAAPTARADRRSSERGGHDLMVGYPNRSCKRPEPARETARIFQQSAPSYFRSTDGPSRVALP